MADRQARIHDNALDAIDEAITKFRSDLKATKPVRQPDGAISEEPAFLMTPRDLCLLIDRFHVLFVRPSSISQHHTLNVSSELPADARQEFIERTRGLAEPAPQESPIPRRLRPLTD
jgi:hypothetical protein